MLHCAIAEAQIMTTRGRHSGSPGQVLSASPSIGARECFPAGLFGPGRDGAITRSWRAPAPRRRGFPIASAGG